MSSKEKVRGCISPYFRRWVQPSSSYGKCAVSVKWGTLLQAALTSLAALSRCLAGGGAMEELNQEEWQ